MPIPMQPVLRFGLSTEQLEQLSMPKVKVEGGEGRRHRRVPHSWVPVPNSTSTNKRADSFKYACAIGRGGVNKCKCTVVELVTTTTLHPFNRLFSRTTWVSRHLKGKTSLDLGKGCSQPRWWVLGCSGISWTICKQSAPRSRQITTPTPHYSIFVGRMLFLTSNQQCQSNEGNMLQTIIEYYIDVIFFVWRKTDL